MRSLTYVPIVHSETDLGSIGGAVRDRYQAAFGKAAWARKFSSVAAMWEGIATRLAELPLDWERTRLYQDGLPVCGREADIVADLARQGSRNHQILLQAMSRGAMLMGTEDPALLLAEYARVKRLVEAARMEAPDDVALELRAEGERLLTRRDDFIAGRIDSTLRDGEAGLLFIGLLHRVDERLRDGFEIHHLIHSLPFGAAAHRDAGGRRTDGH